MAHVPHLQQTYRWTLGGVRATIGAILRAVTAEHTGAARRQSGFASPEPGRSARHVRAIWSQHQHGTEPGESEARMTREQVAMNTHELIGYLASLLVLMTFCMSGMVALRTLAIASNVAFIAYAALVGISPCWCCTRALTDECLSFAASRARPTSRRSRGPRYPRRSCADCDALKHTVGKRGPGDKRKGPALQTRQPRPLPSTMGGNPRYGLRGSSLGSTYVTSNGPIPLICTMVSPSADA